MNASTGLMSLPVLPLKNTVLFPYLLMPLSAGRPASRAAVEAALASEDKTWLVISQRSAEVDEPNQSDLYTVGTRAVIKKMSRSENALDLIVQGVDRVVLERVEQTVPYLKAVVAPLPLPVDDGPEAEALKREV